MTPRGIVIHHTGSTRDDLSVAEVRAWHVHERGWRDIGYHWLISRTVLGWIAQPGRPENEVGSHCPGRNHEIGIAVAGDYERSVPPPEAVTALIELIVSICAQRGWSPSRATTWHRMHAPTLCPGQHLVALLPRILADADQMLPNGSHD